MAEHLDDELAAEAADAPEEAAEAVADEVPAEAPQAEAEAADVAEPEAAAEPASEPEPEPEPAEPEPASSPLKQYLRDPKRLGMIAAIALLVILAIWFIASRSSAAPGVQPEPEPAPVEQPEQEGAEEEQPAEAEPEASAKVYGTGALDGVDDACTDRFGNPTVHAALELEGSVLETLLQRNAWQYYSDDRGWLNTAEDALVMVLGELDWLTDDQIAALAPGAQGSPAIYTFAVTEDQYASAQAAFDALAQVTIVDQEWTEGTGLAVVAAQDGTEALVMVTTDEETGIFSILTVNEEALAAGLFDAQAGGSYGNNPREVFARMCGREAGAQPEEGAAPADEAQTPEEPQAQEGE